VRDKVEMQSFFRAFRMVLRLSVAFIVLMPVGLVAAAEDYDVDIALYGLGAFPSIRGLFAQGGHPTDARITDGLGAGIKVELFPHELGNILGIGLETFGHMSSMSFASTTNAGSRASTNLWVVNSMVNLILRYPAEKLIPYIGVGGGVSKGLLAHTNIPDRNDGDVEGAWTLGYQLFGGVQGNLTRRVFLFSEYKYFSANYHWRQLALDFRSHYVIAGVGLRF
jgi:opacity protein-like surface antigen